MDSYSVDAVMVHDVPRGNDDDEELILTDAPIELDSDLRRYFRRKILTSLKERGVEVVADENEDDSVRTAVAQLIKQPSDLVMASRTIAERLDAVQTGRNPAGLLAVITGTVDGGPCASVLKLEREQGLRFRITTVDGRRIVDLQYLRDLTLTDKTKVFKTSLLVADGKGKASAAGIVGRVSDDQRGSETSAGVASFFLSTFLGCRLRDSPEKSTLEFVQAVDGFINEQVESAERRGRYQVALLATMQDQTGEVKPRSFANTHFDPVDRPTFLDRVREAGLDPDTPFAKDTSLVKVSGFRMTFRSGMVLVGSQDDLQQRVEIRPDDAPTPGVDVNDAIKKLRGR
ncbi:MAG TPA: nucleoid-associated protein [Acidimicrobiales bacterium]|nr:nucleoid-associated protein [Acidimicrobiales bacterium]